MDAPYEVLTNLLRFQLGRGYSPNPFFDLLNAKEKKNYARRGISTSRKITIIKHLSDELGIDAGSIFDDFYDQRLRNAIAHSDYNLTDEEFRCRGGLSGLNGFKICYEELDQKLLCARAFIAAFFQVELLARKVWGSRKQTAIPYDLPYKGLMEVLVDGDDVMCGFKVHWPNNSESMYRRSDSGIEMINCMIDLEHSTMQLFVGLYARKPGIFSPLVEHNAEPRYTELEGSREIPKWPDELVSKR